MCVCVCVECRESRTTTSDCFLYSTPPIWILIKSKCLFICHSWIKKVYYYYYYYYYGIWLHKTTQICFLQMSDMKRLGIRPPKNSNGETEESQVPQISLSIKRRFLWVRFLSVKGHGEWGWDPFPPSLLHLLRPHPSLLSPLLRGVSLPCASRLGMTCC